MRGHHVAELDPLGILDADLADVKPPELELSRYGFTERDLDRDITLGPGILPHFATEGHKTMKSSSFAGAYIVSPRLPFLSSKLVNTLFHRWSCRYTIRPHS